MIYSHTNIYPAVLVCVRIREGEPSGLLNKHRDFRFFVAVPEDIPNVFTKKGSGRLTDPLLPVLGPLTVKANHNLIIGWRDNKHIGLLYNCEGAPVVLSTETGLMAPMTDKHVQIASPFLKHVLRSSVESAVNVMYRDVREHI